ncbi:5-deoxy-glucuronate isomerase [Propionibacterium sp. NM47_B9-13]|jgi:5-deoxy-glucuronate isomerase|uniref:5-deoxy-glucuronate isomerase n=2 Tax=Cutibacterium modestum TaxID=2559073 RepID=A0AAD1KMV4_9ACTN|nr:5-deoxy-glucuronate isomerase [Cutibacterium modestum]TGY28818.1 5-deoxy-glucuronate isomerase [Propionibacterium sp. NM47_B9-13]AOH45224.1 5-deoxy-glucuronate isomerase [Cutibacterium modestum]EFS73194.1 myo-inositol catabolism protein IolB [Cutibacterium modestum HL037PA2]EFS92476.1 myo-inositol catabolism protein IolB [Cutibacterium modestum HL044PA1]EFT14491.1 myo-inositol catabolism protein IolB [Cutibacterium modestum HL037PA3]
MTELIFRSGSTASGCRDVVVDPERAGWTYSGLTIASLAKGETFELITDDHEYLVLPLEGSFTVQGDGFRASLAGRNTVWGEVTDYAFVPRRRTVAVTAVSGGRVALPNALASEDLEPRYCPAEEVRVELRGAGNCSRQVVNYAVSNPLHTSRLLACEVLTPGGNWSSYPPHKHDEESEAEHELEEIYYFEIRGDEHGPGMAFHGTYGTPDRPIHVAEMVANGDVALVPHGWHGPCSAAPGYDLYYLNVMAGPGTAEWKSVDDPHYGWIRQTWEDQDVDPRLLLAVDGSEE